MPYYYNPHTGGIKIPTTMQDRIRSRILAHAAAKYAGQYERIEVRFRGALCYIGHDRGVPTQRVPPRSTALLRRCGALVARLLHLQQRALRTVRVPRWDVPRDAGGRL